ncbi:MAG: hypothetical protein Tsb006_4050 [Rickettsiaceae bacterium]
MKDNKKFFYNNRLNKGYSKVANNNQTDLSLVRAKYKHILPPIDIMEEYEEQHPGTFAKLFDMAQKEQNHRHSMELMELQGYVRATKMGRTFALIFIAIVAISTLSLTITGAPVMAALFAILAFACITIVAYFHSKADIVTSTTAKKSLKKSQPYRRHSNKNSTS